MTHEEALARLKILAQESSGISTWSREALDYAIAALEEEPLAVGWAGPTRFRLRRYGALGKPFYDDYIPVHLNHCPKNGKPVTVRERHD